MFSKINYYMTTFIRSSKMDKIIYGVKIIIYCGDKGVNRMVPSKGFRVFHFLNMEYPFYKNSLSSTHIINVLFCNNFTTINIF